MRRRLPIVFAGAFALAVVPALPAAAAATTWTSPTDAAWSAATWTGPVPGAGDDITFAGGDRSTYDLGDVTFSTFTFTNEHTIANGGGTIGLANGITLAPGADVVVESGLLAVGSQNWIVPAAASLTLPSLVRVDPASTLVLDVDGTVVVTTGNLDAQVTGCIVKTGAGVLALQGGGGSVGSCGPGLPEGLRVTEGEVAIAATANLGGKSFVVDGGVLSGGAGDPSIIRSLSLAPGGTVSPGGAGGAGLGRLDLWGPSSWTGGTYLADVDADIQAADVVLGAGQPIDLGGATLDLRVTGTPDATLLVPVAGSTVAVTGQFRSPAGDLLADGDEFVADGQVWRIEYEATSVIVAWVDAAPQPEPEEPVDPVGVLPATGADVASLAPFGLAALTTIVVGGGLLALRSRRSRDSVLRG